MNRESQLRLSLHTPNLGSVLSYHLNCLLAFAFRLPLESLSSISIFQVTLSYICSTGTHIKRSSRCEQHTHAQGYRQRSPANLSLYFLCHQNCALSYKNSSLHLLGKGKGISPTVSLLMAVPRQTDTLSSSLTSFHLLRKISVRALLSP
jgi:hypothetical protein